LIAAQDLFHAHTSRTALELINYNKESLDAVLQSEQPPTLSGSRPFLRPL